MSLLGPGTPPDAELQSRAGDEGPDSLSTATSAASVANGWHRDALEDAWPEITVNVELGPESSPGNRQAAELVARSRLQFEHGARVSRTGPEEGEARASPSSPKEKEQSHTDVTDRQWPEVEYPAATPLRWAWADPMGLSRRLAKLNPARWSHPRLGPGDLAAALEKEGKKDHAIILRPAEDLYGMSGERDVRFDSIHKAIDWLRMRAQACEESSA